MTTETRERLALELETFLRERTHLVEQRYAAVRESWDARGPSVSMEFKVDGVYSIWASASLADFEAWLIEQTS